MYWYEVIYETGEHSVMSAESDEEALRGISEQHRRATAVSRAVLLALSLLASRESSSTTSRLDRCMSLRLFQ